ncbi:glycoside hydrolase [Pyronema domesticum]|nr:glycoside hydrolase [Pyronema domesticum]
MLSTAMASNERKVFAHYMVCLTYGQTASDWALDISTAKAAGIDGFALNAGPNDSFGDQQLDLAYKAAEAAGFKVFVSFDMGCCGAWDINKVVRWINAYKGSTAQYKVNNVPFVSTFEGPTWADQWANVRSQTGGIYLVPDWSSLGPNGIAGQLGKIDGAFSWEAWANTPGPKTTDADRAYRSTLGSKSYMMGVAPFFYTNIADYNKNWYWGPETLWFDRWEQVLQIMPDFVQIISWNDYGESHYIGNSRESSIIPQAKRYASGIPHDGLRMVLPYYIASYKAGARVSIPNEGAVFWYRTSPKNAGNDGGTTYGPSGTTKAIDAINDVVYVMTLSNTDTSVFVTIGGNGQQFQVKKGVDIVKMPFNSRTGQVRVVMQNGKNGVGAKDIVAYPVNGNVNFNPVVGQTN